jgi:hypothetical protein
MSCYRLKLLYFCFIFISYSTTSAQFRYGLTLGTEVSKLEALPNSVGFHIENNGYLNPCATRGLRAERIFFKKINVTVSETMSSKYSIPASSRGIVPYTKLRFRGFKTTLQLNYMPFSFFRIGAGVSMNYIPIMYDATDRGDESRASGSRKEVGYLFSTGFQYKPFLLELYYYQGIKSFLGYRSGEIIKPLSSIGVSLNYLFTLSKTKK